jgi:hypothetical protein
MSHFLVSDVSATGARFALIEDQGVYHVAAASAERPSRNTFVDCDGAALGPGTVHNHLTGQPIEVVFEAVRCNLSEALRMLQK